MVKDILPSDKKHDICGNCVFGKHHLQHLTKAYLESQLSTLVSSSNVCGLMKTSSYVKTGTLFSLVMIIQEWLGLFLKRI